MRKPNDQQLRWKVRLAKLIDFVCLLSIAAAFDAWFPQVRLLCYQKLEELGNHTRPPIIGVDASYFLEQLYCPHQKEWVAALGGFPLAFETQIIKVINEIESFGLKLHFVFNGLQIRSDEPQFNNSISETITRAFKAYGQKDGIEQARDLFTSSGIVIV